MHELEKNGSSRINPGFNSFYIVNLIICLSLALIPPTTSLPCPGAPTSISKIIESYKSRHDSG